MSKGYGRKLPPSNRGYGEPPLEGRHLMLPFFAAIPRRLNFNVRNSVLFPHRNPLSDEPDIISRILRACRAKNGDQGCGCAQICEQNLFVLMLIFRDPVSFARLFIFCAEMIDFTEIMLGMTELVWSRGRKSRRKSLVFLSNFLSAHGHFIHHKILVKDWKLNNFLYYTADRARPD